MNPQSLVIPFWSTASFGDATAPSELEFAALGEHLHLCRGGQGRWFTLQCMAEQADGFVSSRLVTTLAVGALFIGVMSLMV